MKGNSRSVWKNYFQMLNQAGLPWLLMAVCFGLSMLIAQLTLIFADKLGTTLVAYDDIKQATGPLFLLFVIGIIIIAVKAVNAWLQSVLTAQVDRNLQKYAVEKAFWLKTSDIEKGDPRELITRLTEDTSKSSVFLTDLAVNEIPRLYYIVMALIQVIGMKRPILILCTLGIVPIIFLGSWIGGKITFNNRNQIQEKISTLTARLAEKIDNIEIIKAYNRQDRETAAGDVIIDELDKVKKKGVLIDQINAFIKNMMWFLPLLVIIIPPALMMFRGEMNQGEFYAYILIVTTFRTKCEEHLTLWIYLKEAQGASLRLSEIMSLNDEKTGNGKMVSDGNIEFSHVSFAYGENEVLKDVSFVIEKGRKTALVGLSGSGKSTVLNLIEKFYDVQDGKILFNNEDINSLDTREYRKRFAYLPQNAAGFSGSIRDMLLFSSDKDPGDEKLKEVLDKVGLSEFSLDDEIGYEGENLSGGQRQKLGIARMLLSDAEYILLDEATSALDGDATRDLQKEIDDFCRNKTQILVAHDLSTVENADTILLFEKGKLVSKGKHEELKASSEYYRMLGGEA